jgi:hypothetical protein
VVLDVRFQDHPIFGVAAELGRRLPLAIPMHERLLVAVAHSRAVVPVSAKTGSGAETAKVCKESSAAVPVVSPATSASRSDGRVRAQEGYCMIGPIRIAEAPLLFRAST